MQKYITQLIEDLHQIAKEVNPSGNTEDEPIHDDESFFRHISDVENYLHGEQIPVSEITGILHEQLPPPENLSEKQQAQLTVELECFLEYFHFVLDFPQNYPNHLRYPFIRKFWTEKHTVMQFGNSHIEFCNYEKENCPFLGYCSTCDDFNLDNEDSDNTKFVDTDAKDLPF